MKKVLLVTVKVITTALCIALVAVTVLFFWVTREPKRWQESGKVNDVTHLNPISVRGEFRPQSVEEIIRLLKENPGTVSIGGARHSMGGQIASDSAIHLDMRKFNQVVSFSKQEKLITVQSGITWRMVQEHIDPYDLSVSIMQTYANFTVGGSLSVNVHGRYIGQGPIIHSVKEFTLILANGEVKICSRDQNADLFYGVIGGYGGLGIIAEVTLMLTENCRVERSSVSMRADEYAEYFSESIRDDRSIVFHNGDIYPDDYTEIRAVTYRKTNDSVTVQDRLKPVDSGYRWERFGMWLVSEMSFGKWLRKEVADPLYYQKNKIVWRNYEASYDANELEPASREHSTYVLQEYFVPINEFENFVPRMAEIFQRNEVNVINVSVRHAKADTASLLSWARQEVFCFVIYYKQGVTEEDREQVGNWTRELVDAAIMCRGSYYLPYQLYATQKQFKLAYPRSDEYFKLKKEVDASGRFRNKLLDKYANVR